MEIIELDLTGCIYLDEIHERIKVAFGFPEWYGKNWSAFWDLLWSECDADMVMIKGEDTLSEKFNQSLSTLHQILDEKTLFNRKCGFRKFSYEIVHLPY